MAASNGDVAMEGLFPFLGTILFGKCPTMNMTKIVESDDGIENEDSLRIPSEVEVRTTDGADCSSSCTLEEAKSDQILKAYRAENCEETTMSPSLLLGSPQKECEKDTFPESPKRVRLKEQTLSSGSRPDDATPRTAAISESQGYSFQSTDTNDKNKAEPTISTKPTKTKKRARVVLPDDFGAREGRSLLRTESFCSRLSRGAASKSVKSSASRATSIASSSKSMKSLPREIELKEVDEAIDEETDESPTTTVIPRNNRQRSKSSQLVQVTRQIWTNKLGLHGIYSGSFAEAAHEPHGFGRFQHNETGEWYEGQFCHGEMSGQGRKLSPSGDFYEGTFSADHEHGVGIKKFQDGRVFEGQFARGHLLQGEMRYEDGSTYAGEWMNEMKHGRGHCVFSDGSLYVGQFKTGTFNGYGKMLWVDGGYYEGEWEEGEMSGYGKEVLPNGNCRHEGQWAHGLPVRNYS